MTEVAVELPRAPALRQGPSAEGEVVAHVIGVVSDEQLDAGVRAARVGEVVGPLTGGASRPQR